MKAVTFAVAITVLAASGAAGQQVRSVEIGTGTIVFSNVETGDQLLDMVVVRVAASSYVRRDITVGPVLTWRYQLSHDDRVWFDDDEALRGGPSRNEDENDAFFSIYELTLRALVLDPGAGLHTFAELEGGFASVDDWGGRASDCVFSARFGVSWRRGSAPAVLVGIGQRLYLASERYMVPITVDVAVGF